MYIKLNATMDLCMAELYLFSYMYMDEYIKDVYLEM